MRCQYFVLQWFKLGGKESSKLIWTVTSNYRTWAKLPWISTISQEKDLFLPNCNHLFIQPAAAWRWNALTLYDWLAIRQSAMSLCRIWQAVTLKVLLLEQSSDTRDRSESNSLFGQDSDSPSTCPFEYWLEFCLFRNCTKISTRSSTPCHPLDSDCADGEQVINHAEVSIISNQLWLFLSREEADNCHEAQ